MVEDNGLGEKLWIGILHRIRWNLVIYKHILVENIVVDVFEKNKWKISEMEDASFEKRRVAEPEIRTTRKIMKQL